MPTIIYKLFKENKIAIFAIGTLLLCLSIGVLNRMIEGRAVHLIERYYKDAGMLYRMFSSFIIPPVVGILVYLLFIRRKVKLEDRYFYLLFAVCLAAHLGFSSVGWNNSISDQHGFRQTQTAITTYYVIKDGFRLDYITPVLGKPWSIPIEFPLYQWIVAVLVLISGIHLEQAGRCISLAFFYLSLIPVYQLLGYFVSNRSHRLIFLSLLLASPVYIFWSRTLMIESLAMFLSLSFLVAAAKTVTARKPVMMLVACAVGTLAGLAKITTFLVFCVPAFSLCAWLWVKEHKNAGLSPKQFIYILLIFAAPLVINAAWIAYADQLKSLNPISDGYINSKALKCWTFGTIAQKFSFSTWKKFAGSYFPLVCWGTMFWNYKLSFAVYFFIYFVLLLKKSRYYPEALSCLVFFLVGPLIFTNLYHIHEYYWYSNGVFLLISIGFLILSLLEDVKWKIVTKYVIIPVIVLAMYFSYFNSYFYLTAYNRVFYPSLVNAIKEFTKIDDVILVYGFEWSSELSYYSQRRALMDPFWLPYKSERFQRALRELGNDKITAMVVNRQNYKGSQALNRKLLLQYKEVKELLRKKLGREPEIGEIAGYLGLAKERIEQAEILFYSGSSNIDTDFIQERIENLKLNPSPVFREGDIELYVGKQV